MKFFKIIFAVNNVGVGYKAFVCFHDLPDKVGLEY